MKLFSDDTLEHAGLEYAEEDILAHAGVRGMKWGVSRAHGIDTGSLSKAKAVGLGLYGNKARFSDPAALAQRKTAGKLRTASILTAAASLGVSKIKGPNMRVNYGRNIVSSLLQVTAGGLNVAATANAYQAINKQQKSEQ